MKPFPLRFLEYDPLKRVMFGMDICETVSLALMSPEIRETVRSRDLENVKMSVNYTPGRCVIEVKYNDGSSSKMLFFQCKTFPTSTSTSYNIGGYPFKMSKTTNSCVIYTGEHINGASVMLMEHLLTIFKSSKVHLHLEKLPMESLHRMISCEAFNYVHLRKIEGRNDAREAHWFEEVFLAESQLPQSRKLLPEYRPVVSENRFRTDSVEAWMEDFHARKCPKIEIDLHMDQNKSFMLKSTMQAWQHGVAPCFQDLTFISYLNETSYEYPHFLSITDGLENLTCWDSIGRREAFYSTTGTHLIHGYDFAITDDLRASYIAYRSSPSSKANLEFVFWKPASVA